MSLQTFTAQLILESRAHESYAGNETEPYPQLVSSEFLIGLVQSIHSLYHFTNFVFYISERLNINTDTSAEFFHDFWSTFPIAANVIIRQHYHAACSMPEFISTPSLMLVLTTGRNDPIMELAANSLKSVRWLKTVFVLFPILKTDDFYADFETHTLFWNTVQSTYAWVWEKQFIHTLLVTIRDNVYVLEPYPTPTVINQTSNWTAVNFFQRYTSNMKGYVVSVPFLSDIPRVFKTDRKRNNYEENYIRGSSANLLQSFFEFVNATVNDTSNGFSGSPFNLDLFLNLMTKNVFEILPNSYTAMMGYDVGSSYPIGINDWCIMVPYRNRSPEHLYLRGALQSSTWMLCFFAIFYITVAIWLCSPRQPRDFSGAFLQAICSIIFIVPTSILTMPTIRMRYLYFLLFLLGFFSSNMYISRTASYLTSHPPQSQINTPQDIIDAKLRIMVVDYEYEMMNVSKKEFPPRFLHQLVVVEKNELDQHRNAMNISYGYSVTTDRWNFLNMQQEFLRKPVFRITDICTGPYYHVYPIQIDSHLSSPLQNFIMITQQSGFMHIWEIEAFWEAIHLKIARRILVDEEPLSLSNTFFSGIWNVWCLGLVIAGFAFIAEIKWFHCRCRRQQRQVRAPKKMVRRSQLIRKPQFFFKQFLRS